METKNEVAPVAGATESVSVYICYFCGEGLVPLVTGRKVEEFGWIHYDCPTPKPKGWGVYKLLAALADREQSTKLKSS